MSKSMSCREKQKPFQVFHIEKMKLGHVIFKLSTMTVEKRVYERRQEILGGRVHPFDFSAIMYTHLCLQLNFYM